MSVNPLQGTNSEEQTGQGVEQVVVEKCLFQFPTQIVQG